MPVVGEIYATLQTLEYGVVPVPAAESRVVDDEGIKGVAWLKTAYFAKKCASSLCGSVKCFAECEIAQALVCEGPFQLAHLHGILHDSKHTELMPSRHVAAESYPYTTVKKLSYGGYA